ncbi:MAG: TonB family protein [Acidobacteriota bacterium]
MSKNLLIRGLQTGVVSGCVLVLISVDAHHAAPWQAGPAMKEDLANDHIKKAKEAYDTKRFRVAKEEAQRALKLKKDSPEANLLLALAYRNLNKPKDSLKYAKEAVKYRQEYADAHYLLAVLLYDKNELEPASAELSRAISQGARFSNAYVLKGTLELLAGRNQSALQTYKEALKLASPNDALLPQLRERATALENYIEFTTHRSNASLKGPVLLNFPAPRYTEAARQNRVQGAVRAAVLINEQGTVNSVILLSHLGWGLDEEAIIAVQRLKFSPATRDAKPVSFWKPVLIEFNLR